MSKPTKNEFEVIVIGDNWTSLFIANSLSKSKKVAYVQSKPTNNLFPTSSNLAGDFDFFPVKEGVENKIQWMNEQFQLDLEETQVASQPLTIDSGKLVQFLGFGERAGHSIENLSWYNEENRLQLNKTSFQMKEELKSTFQGELFGSQEITQFIIKDGRVEAVELNGQKTLKAQSIIYCDAPNGLLNIIDHNEMPTKFRQKITKTKPLSGLQIIYKHKEALSESQELHFLMGNKEDFEPCVGYFWTNKASEEHCSQWMSLIPSDLTEDIEKVGATLKNMKRQIKRAYPDFYENIEFEKVIVKDQTHGFIDLEFKELGKMKGINNLYCASPLFTKESDLWAAIEVAKSFVEHPDLGA